jgi:hypothetical protein
MLDSLRFARMSGSSIAKPVASWWVTDFLNAAFHARSAAERDVDDLRLAFGILTTRWQRSAARRLGATDVAAYHGAFGPARLRGRGRLSRASLLAGARRLVGDWFEDAWADEDRRAHGIAFPTTQDRISFDPGERMRGTALGPITPPVAPDAQRHWATYDPVELADPRAAAASRALALVELATHAGHFLGRAVSRLLVYEAGGTAFVRDIGCWDPLPWHLATAYATAARRAQEDFWGPQASERSMLELALVSAVRA